MKKKNIISIFSVTIFFLVSFSFFYFQKNTEIRQEEKIHVSNEILEKNEEDFARFSIADIGDVECEEGWDKYIQNTIGISFCYPEYWGEPYTEPSRNITELDGIVEKYSEHNSYYHSIFISFSDLQKLKLRIFDEEYPGQHYPNAGTYHLGYMDNISVLKKTRDVCDYEINFNKKWDRHGKKNEIYEQCNENIKEYIVETEQYFSGLKYSYDLKMASYKRLENNFFDNLLIIYSIDNINQINGRIIDLDGFFANTGADVTKELYENTKNDFKTFTNSIRSFSPVKKEYKDCNTVEDIDNKVVFIKKYYCHLSNEELDKAFEMRADNLTDRSEFNKWYAKINKAVPQDFIKNEDGSYEFHVDYQEYNGVVETYRVVMSVQNEKLNTIFSEKYLSDVAKSVNGHIAYGARRGEENMMILNIDGKETVLDKGDAEYDENHSNIGGVKHFFKSEFSKTGRYLLYGMSGWEWSEARIFDVKKMEQVLKLDSPSNIGFLQNDRYFFACSSAGLGSAVDGKVYSLPDFELLFDLTGDKENIDFTNVECEKSESGESVIFKKSHFYDPQKSHVDDEKVVERVFHLE